MDFFKAVREALVPPPTTDPAELGRQRGEAAAYDHMAEDIAAAEDARIVAQITAAVTDPDAPYVEPPLPESYCCERGLDIPPFLMRRRGGGWVYPSLHVKPPAGGLVSRVPVPAEDPREKFLYNWSDDKLWAASETMSLEDRQPIYRELHKREEAKRARHAKLNKDIAS